MLDEQPTPADKALIVQRFGYVGILIRCCTVVCAVCDGASNGLADVDQISPPVIAPQPRVVEVKVRVTAEPEAVKAPGSFVSVTDVCIGATLYVEAWVTSWKLGPPGLTGGSIDITFSPSLLVGQLIDHGTQLGALPMGTIDNVRGVVDDLGGNTLSADVAMTPNWALLGRVSFTAVANGDATILLSPGAFRFALAGGAPPLSFASDVELGPLVTVHVHAVGLVGDYDCDADVDLDDYAAFQRCFRGPNTVVGECGIVESDEDDDGDTDLFDFAILQTSFSASVD